MSYLIVVAIGAIVGFIGGQALKASRHGSWVDAIVGMVGSVAAVAATRNFLPAANTDWIMSGIAAVGGALLVLFIKSQFTIHKPPPAERTRFSR